MKGNITVTKISKEVQIQDSSQDHKFNLNLRILQLMDSGLPPTEISKKLGIKKSTLQYHLNQLKDAGAIRKIGYGTWEVIIQCPTHEKRSSNSTQVTLDKTCGNLNLLKPDTVRGHAFMFTLKVPLGLRNWNNRKREWYLKNRGIPFQHLGIAGGGQRIIFKDRKIWLTNRSVVVYEKGSYFADTAEHSKKHAILKFLTLIKSLERFLKVDFTFNGGREYRFKVSKQHYALVRNALAQQYDYEGKQLKVSNSNGLWFVIDNSFNLHEAETVHPCTADSDNATVMNFLNSLKKNPVTVDQLLCIMYDLGQNQLLFSENKTTNIQAVQDLGKAVKELNQLLAELNERLQRNNFDGLSPEAFDEEFKT